MKKIFTYIFNLLMFMYLGVSSTLKSQTLITHDFNDGGFGPYEVNKSDQESRVYIKNGAVETHWLEELYGGSNSNRKAQFRSVDDIIFTQHIWMGLSLKVHDDYMKDNTNTNAGLMQIWGYNGATTAANHMCMLKFDGRNGGALVWQHRYNSVANKTHYLVLPNFPRNEFVDIVVHVQLKNRDEGIVQIWVNGELKLDKVDQTIGWGDMDETGMINGTYCFGTSLGQYNFFADANYDDAYDGNNHWFDGHLEGETRTVTYDNVSLYNGEDGYSLVDPGGRALSCLKSTSKTEAECYDDSLGIQVVDGSVLGYIENGDWASYNRLDLTDMNSVEVTYASQTSGGIIELRLDALDGEVIGEMELAGTGGWDTWETENVNIERVDGSHDLYLVFTGGDGYLFDLDKFGFSEEVLCDNTTGHVEAECFDDMFEIESENCAEGTQNIGWIQDGDWAMYGDLDLTGMNSIKARVSGNTTGSIIEVRIDGEDGEIIGEIPVTNTGGNQSWVTDSVNIELTNGVHDVYLKFSGGDGYLFNINHFGFSEESIVVTGLNDHLIQQLVVYPNPAVTKLHILDADGFQYELSDINGIIYTKSIIDQDNFTLNIQNKMSGVYLLKVFNSEEVYVKKIIVK